MGSAIDSSLRYSLHITFGSVDSQKFSMQASFFDGAVFSHAFFCRKIIFVAGNTARSF